ncbi:unnamed protein product [Miscanthus lutarioriparius]|uniref:NB-ARC domain-containing protein n=1 Tax=Miscanthus lutarioriparius TaxID=422564 RepID=A0A811QN57_9POAL|nr:unnamed protein product [Miscanthus lutarioriparius]
MACNQQNSGMLSPPSLRDINTTIVVTTKIQGVAKFCSLPNCYVYNMGKLSDDHSKQLLLKAADLEKYSDSSLSDSKAILKICDGQPLALSTVGKFMKKRSLMEGPDWDGICNQLRCHLGSDDSLDRVHQALMHEYTSLPSCAIKACLLYFAMFPSDHRVKPQRIMRQWLAEGFVEPENSLGDTVDKCFEELLDRSIVHPIGVSNNKTVKTCRTYGMMHEYVMLKSLSENLIMLCDNGNYQNSKNNGNFQTTQHRCLSLQDSSISDSSSLDSDLSLVRNLIVFGKAGSMLNFDRYQLLRVLDLEECTDLQNHHVKKVCNLLLLKYLSLGGDVHVTSLPKKIENLKLLETLDLRRTAINILPKEVFQLPHLTHLFGKFKLPDKAIPSEQCKLQMVKRFIIDERVGYDAFLGRMKKLRNVKIWCESSATNTSLTSLQKAIQEFIRDEKDAKKDRRSLSIQFDACSEDFLKGLEGQCYLRSLKLNGMLEELPGFVTGLRGLKELCLQSTKLKAALLTALGTLEHLKYLKLIAGELDDFVLQRNALPSLVCIRFVLKSPTLPTMEHGAMPILKSLQLLCDGLNGLSGLQINYFTHLREVILDAGVEVNSTTIQNWQDAAANHPNRPKVILLNALDSTEGASIRGSAESWANKNGAETHMLPNGLMTESSIASNITVES